MAHRVTLTDQENPHPPCLKGGRIFFPSIDDCTVRGDQAATKVDKGAALMVPEATAQNSEVVWLATTARLMFSRSHQFGGT